MVNQEQLNHYESKLAFEIDSWDLKVALDANENIVVIDARSTESYAVEHIPGAINIPHRQMTAESTRGISRDATVVTYCDGIGCNGSTKGALAMAKLGFRVKELIGGLDWWKRDGHLTSSDRKANQQSTPNCGCDRKTNHVDDDPTRAASRLLNAGSADLAARDKVDRVHRHRSVPLSHELLLVLGGRLAVHRRCHSSGLPLENPLLDSSLVRLERSGIRPIASSALFD